MVPRVRQLLEVRRHRTTGNFAVPFAVRGSAETTDPVEFAVGRHQVTTSLNLDWDDWHPPWLASTTADNGEGHAAMGVQAGGDTSRRAIFGAPVRSGEDVRLRQCAAPIQPGRTGR
jgi:hypothetical protein